MKEEHIIFHIDVNSAFLSWTSVENLKTGKGPDLRDIPAVIGGDESARHGIVLAKSVPAKKYGIHTADTLVSARSACPNLVIAPPDHKLYRAYSRALMEELHKITDQIEKASIDECYMDFTQVARERFRDFRGGCERDGGKLKDTGEGSDIGNRNSDFREFLVSEATAIKDHVREKFGFTVNVGISDRKVLSKMASDFEKPDKVHTLFHDEIEEKMWPLSVDELYMAGHASAAQLHMMGLHTIGDLALADRELIASSMKSHGVLLWQYANGIDHSKVETVRPEAKGIGASVTMAEDAETTQRAHEVLGDLAKEVGRRIRKEEKTASNICVEIKYADFTRNTHQRMLTDPTDRDEEIGRYAKELFDASWTGMPVRLLGIRLTKLSDRTAPRQLSIFDLMSEDYVKDQEKEKRFRALDSALEKVKKRYGEDTVRRGYVKPDMKYRT